jgi:hypothetical protein
VSEQFEKLARTVIQSQQVDEGVAILIEGNPESVPDDELVRIADIVLAEAVARLTGGSA